MRNIARLSDNDRRELFRNTADKMGLNDAIVEKDFWVCFTLDYLFHRSPWKESITFKGGTSLSKAFHLISRFSEDIDLILDWRVLGYGKDEPWEKRSNTKQDAFNKEANVRAEVFLSETFCPAVKAGLSQEIGCEANVYIDEKDKQTVIFAYPHLFTNTATLQVIRLEIGALAAWTPAKTAQIEPYAAKYYPKIFEQKETAILTVAPERTFWEKATILHHEANRPEHLEMPQRYSRHYYDLYRIGNLYPLNYREHVERMKKLTCPIGNVAVAFADGNVITIPYQERRQLMNRFMPEHGAPKTMTYLPENEPELMMILKRERFKRSYHATAGNLEEYLDKLEKTTLREKLKIAKTVVSTQEVSSHKRGLER